MAGESKITGPDLSAEGLPVDSLRTDLGLAPEIHADLKRRFYQEASAAGRLNHPAIVAVHDVLEIGDTPYIVMEYVEGQTLAGLVRAEGPLPPPQAADMIVQVCGALECAHAHGVVHRDGGEPPRERPGSLQARHRLGRDPGRFLCGEQAKPFHGRYTRRIAPQG